MYKAMKYIQLGIYSGYIWTHTYVVKVKEQNSKFHKAHHLLVGEREPTLQEGVG